MVSLSKEEKLGSVSPLGLLKSGSSFHRLFCEFEEKTRYRVVPFNLKVLVKYGITCSHNFCNCSHARILVKMGVYQEGKTRAHNAMARGNTKCFCSEAET